MPSTLEFTTMIYLWVSTVSMFQEPLYKSVTGRELLVEYS